MMDFVIGVITGVVHYTNNILYRERGLKKSGNLNNFQTSLLMSCVTSEDFESV